MSYLYKTTLFFCLSILVIACGSSGSENEAAPVQEEQKTVEASAAEQEDLFAIAKTFDELAPIFKHSNDTTYVINFWATWCGPCVKELPYFEQLNAEMTDKPVKTILVSLDFPKDIERKLKPFLAQKQYSSEVILLLDGDYNAWIDRVNPDWGGAIPVTYVYRDKTVEFHDGEFESYEELKEIVEKLL